MDDCEYDPDEIPGQWAPGSVADELEKLGDKPPKGGKGRHGQKKPKDKRENPDFEDMPGYGGIAFGKDTEFKPPAPPSGPSGDPPKMDFPDLPKLSKDDCQEALKKFVEGQMCYGSKPAKEMEITDVKGGLALHLKMETFTENRSTKKKKKPYKGGSVDGPENGEPPAPWNVACDFKAEFKDAKVKKEVPHTAKVKKCKDCKGKGYEKCDDCDGWGKVECDQCDGSGVVDEVNCPFCIGGNKRCMDCGGDGRVTCDDCEGYKKLKCFVQLKVKFINHDDEYIYETTDLPDELVANVGGNVIFEEKLPMVWPITGYPVPEINKKSQEMVSTHSKKWPNELIHQQRQTLRGVPVTEVHYKWDDQNLRYWIYGTEQKIYAPDYPQQCCCGCSII
ncbi:protein SSUH2 homolog isoform X2 [Mya arenaria]|uniref:protein SSUH2 homolog isoform X2 n=1 Tax=Mya arenaria TaxID=6604 RepID=UPI0022E1EFCA|nr:protein SSUH2 homolog isoform X2 [Mya arenaria]XP_052779802.1 protein SSUH2 homolog isoform X2 [Mya arenaria]